jgi:hypothetical protein
MTDALTNHTHRTAPNSWLWYSVDTPSVFREYKLPTDDTIMTRTHKRQYRELQELAEIHGCRINALPYRRG